MYRLYSLQMLLKFRYYKVRSKTLASTKSSFCCKSGQYDIDVQESHSCFQCNNKARGEGLYDLVIYAIIMSVSYNCVTNAVAVKYRKDNLFNKVTCHNNCCFPTCAVRISSSVRPKYPKSQRGRALDVPIKCAFYWVAVRLFNPCSL